MYFLNSAPDTCLVSLDQAEFPETGLFLITLGQKNQTTTNEKEEKLEFVKGAFRIGLKVKLGRF